jgi:hypothetical protein
MFGLRIATRILATAAGAEKRFGFWKLNDAALMAGDDDVQEQRLEQQEGDGDPAIAHEESRMLQFGADRGKWCNRRRRALLDRLDFGSYLIDSPSVAAEASRTGLLDEDLA